MTAQTLRNVGKLHAVFCHWCDLKMACNCFFDRIEMSDSRAHPIVLCPKCQVTEFLNVLHGRKDQNVNQDREQPEG